MERRNIKEIQDRINTAFSGVMSILAIGVFLISGEKYIMFITGSVFCVINIINFLIDIFFMVKNKKRDNCNEDG